MSASCFPNNNFLSYLWKKKSFDISYTRWPQITRDSSSKFQLYRPFENAVTIIRKWKEDWIPCVDSCAAWEIREVILKADGPAVRILWSIDCREACVTAAVRTKNKHSVLLTILQHHFKLFKLAKYTLCLIFFLILFQYPQETKEPPELFFNYLNSTQECLAYLTKSFI